MRIHVALATLALACSSTIPHPPYAPQPQSALVEVDAPPPPGRVEALPPRPSRSAIWVDGEWVWRRMRWSWLPGRWLEAPADAFFAPWAFVRGPDGRLWYAAGAWRDGKGSPVAAPRPLAIAVVSSVDVVNASGDTASTGPTVRRP
jgi:hypothetical protein